MKEEAQPGSPLTLRGIVIANDWYLGGEPSEVCISCQGEREYVVRKSRHSDALCRLLGREVEVVATLATVSNGSAAIDVISFTTVDEVVVEVSDGFFDCESDLSED